MEFQAIEAFKPHFGALARIAYLRNPIKSASRRTSKIQEFSRLIVWILVILYNSQHVINVIVHRNNTDRIVDTLFILLTTLNAMGKQAAFNLRAPRIAQIVGVIDGHLFAPRRPSQASAAKANATEMRRLLNLNIGAIFTCGTFWTIFPLLNRALGEEVRFSAYFPYDTSPSPIFELTVVYMSILITLQAYGNVSMDCTIVSFYAQAKLQLNMVRDNMQNLLGTIDSDGKVTKRRKAELEIVPTGFLDVDDTAFGEILQKRLSENVEHYRTIVWFLDEIENIFVEALLFQFLISAWVVCMTVYKIVDLNLLSAEFVSMALYLMCILGQLFQYCYYGTQVKTESELVNDSIYSCDWVMLSPRFRRQLLLMMTRCYRPLVPRVSYIIPISLDTFLAVVKSSYTLFTFLNKRKQNPSIK